MYTLYFRHIRAPAPLSSPSHHLPFPTSLPLFNNPLNPVGAAHMHRGWDHPLGPWQPTTGHTPEDNLPPPPASSNCPQLLG